MKIGLGVQRVKRVCSLLVAPSLRQMEGGKRGMEKGGKFRYWKETGKKDTFVFPWINRRWRTGVITPVKKKKTSPKPVLNCFAFGLRARGGSGTWLLHSSVSSLVVIALCQNPFCILLCDASRWACCSAAPCVWQIMLSKGPWTGNKGRAGPAANRCNSVKSVRLWREMHLKDVLVLWGYRLWALDNWSAEDVFRFLGFTFLLQ